MGAAGGGGGLGNQPPPPPPVIENLPCSGGMKGLQRLVLRGAGLRQYRGQASWPRTALPSGGQP